MEYKKTIPVALVISALSFMLLFADFQKIYALEVVSVTGLTNVRNAVPYTTGIAERVFVLRDSNPVKYSVYEYSNSTGTPALNLVTSGNILIGGANSLALQNYVQFAEDSARLWFGIRNGTGDDTGYIASFNKATNAITTYSVGRCAPIYMLMVGSELFTGSLQAGTTGTVCTQTRQLTSYDTNTLNAGGTVNVPVWNSGASESGYLCNTSTTNTIIMAEDSPASPRIQPINYLTHTLGTRFGSGVSAYNGGCTTDGTFTYGLRGDGTIDKFTGSAMTTTGWKTGLGAPTANAGTQLDYKSGQIYASSNANLFIIKTSDASTVAQIATANANAQTLASRGVFYYITATTVNRVKDQIVAFDEDGGGNEPNPTGGIDCTLPENENILTCRLNSIGGNELASYSDLIGTSFGNGTNNIFVQLGLVEEGSDIRTNGVGYGMTLVGLGLMIVMFYLGSGGQLNRIPTFVWFLGTLAVIGISTGFGFVDPLWLIISILVIIALASAKILSTLEIGGFR